MKTDATQIVDSTGGVFSPEDQNSEVDSLGVYSIWILFQIIVLLISFLISFFCITSRLALVM